jgi:hypothetical protein
MSPLEGWTASVFWCCWETLHSNSRGRREGLRKVKGLVEEQPTQVGLKKMLLQVSSFSWSGSSLLCMFTS